MFTQQNLPRDAGHAQTRPDHARPSSNQQDCTHETTEPAPIKRGIGGGVGRGRIALALTVYASLVFFRGCAAGPADTRGLLPSASQARINGDWDDIDAAIDVGATEAEMAVLSADLPTGGRRIIRLKTVQDQPVILVIDRAGDPQGAAGAGPGGASEGEITMRCTVGRFGDPAREARLLKALSHRLKALWKVQTRPLD